jgi:(p)ppGpp synthase/HD superfamily hydrolase
MNRYQALKHAVKAHAGQVDKCGQPYILHPIAVAETIEAMETATAITLDEDEIVVALLHDVIEDTGYVLPAESLSGGQANALRAITRQSARQPFPETYAEYIERVCADLIASVVKLADLAHNLSPERQACLPEKEQRSLEKRYLKARDRIWKALGHEWWPESDGVD